MAIALGLIILAILNSLIISLDELMDLQIDFSFFVPKTHNLL